MAKSKSSRKSPSRKSSSRKSDAQKSIIINNYKSNHINIISTIINILIIYYLNNLEHNYCDCIHDWRHNYIKYAAVFFLFIDLLIVNDIDFENIYEIISIVKIVFLISFYTYIRDLDITKCECAVVKQKQLHKFLNIWRYVIIIVPFIILLFIIIFISSSK